MAEGAAIAAVIANAIKASGVVVKVRPEDFVNIIRRVEKPLVIYSAPGFFSRGHKYLTSYKGFAFFTQTPEPIRFASGVETVIADKIWIPS